MTHTRSGVGFETVIFRLRINAVPFYQRIFINPLLSTYRLDLFFYLSMALQLFIRPCLVFIFLMVYTVGWTPWMGVQPVARPLPAHRSAQTQNKPTQTSTPQVGFESTVPVFERVKTVLVLNRTTTVIGNRLDLSIYLFIYLSTYLSIYSSTALVDLSHFFSFLICTLSIGLLGRGIFPSQGLYVHTGQHKHKIKAHRHRLL
jgi:hypothetical protein